MESLKIIQVDEKVPFNILIPLSIQHLFAFFPPGFVKKTVYLVGTHPRNGCTQPRRIRREFFGFASVRTDGVADLHDDAFQPCVIERKNVTDLIFTKWHK